MKFATWFVTEVFIPLMAVIIALFVMASTITVLNKLFNLL